MRTRLTVAAAVLFGLVIAGAPAFAQTAKVTIPFGFTLTERALPAGTYELSIESPDIIKIESREDPSIQMFVSVVDRLSESDNPGGARIVFKKSGAKEVVSEVWFDEDTGFAVYVPKA